MQADEDVGKVAQATPVVVCEYHQVAVEESFLREMFLSSTCLGFRVDRLQRSREHVGGRRLILHGHCS